MPEVLRPVTMKRTCNADSRQGRAFRLVLSVLVLLVLASGLFAPGVRGQDVPQRQLRTYIPPDQLVSFLPTTPMNEFFATLTPIFQRVTGKQIVDPESRQIPIGITIAGMHFFDAFELVLEYNGLTYRETDQYFIVEVAPAEDILLETPGTLQVRPQAAEPVEILATAQSREIQINAVIFEVNHTQARQLGIDWNVIFGDQQQQQGGQQGGGQGQEIPRWYVRGDRIFDRFDDYLISPDRIDVAVLTQLFRLLESTGAGETLAQPSVTVQSGEEGRIQIGSDIPVTVRDFAGNTVNQFVSTGIIINVVPTLIRSPLADTAGAPTMEFIHMNVQVERSSGRPFGGSIAIDRSTANTQVLLLDREQTIIGGLYSTEVSTNRRGIPILKDLPPWFFGLRYLFGFENKIYTQRELVIVLQARLVDPLPVRAEQPLPDQLREEFRQRVIRVLNSFDRRQLRQLLPGDAIEEQEQ